jgi:hypothetical protein
MIALQCSSPEYAFKLKYALKSWDVEQINRKKYRDITHTQTNDLKRMLQIYINPRIIELGEVKLLTWKSDTYILTHNQKIAREREMRKA